MARPARVRMRSRKPCVLARRRLFGWKVRLLTVVSPRHVGRAGDAEAGSLTGAERLVGPHPQPADPLATARFAGPNPRGDDPDSAQQPGEARARSQGTDRYRPGQTEANALSRRAAEDSLRHTDFDPCIRMPSCGTGRLVVSVPAVGPTSGPFALRPLD